SLTFGEQFYRNLAYTGRLTGVTESFVNLTDPHGEVLALEKDKPLVSGIPHGFRQRYVNTFIHVLTLYRWLKPTEFGFPILPSPRLAAIAAVLLLVVAAF